mgnify:CR=1 FL=1
MKKTEIASLNGYPLPTNFARRKNKAVPTNNLGKNDTSRRYHQKSLFTGAKERRFAQSAEPTGPSIPSNNASLDSKETCANTTKSSSEQKRYYLNIPYKHKEQAKQLGCGWDPDEKKWYCCEPSDAISSLEANHNKF